MRYDASTFVDQQTSVKFENAGNSLCFVDNAVFALGNAVTPVNYAVRFTNTYGREVETRLYDGGSAQVVTSSAYDEYGRLSRKYLPFAMSCSDAESCNSEMTTLDNPAMAADYYTASNPDYPDAQGFPYEESVWKPESNWNVDFVGMSGMAFSVGSGHVAKTYTSGIDLDGVNLLDSAAVGAAVKAVSFNRSYDNMQSYRSNNYCAQDDGSLSYIWNMNEDQNGQMSFSVTDASDRVILSGSLEKSEDGSEAVLRSYSLSEYDRYGHLIKSHPPMSCEYNVYKGKSNCVKPSEYKYDYQGNAIWSWEPDAGVTLSYYDYAGRLRATQTQNQIGKSASIVGYDHLDRTVYTGEWATSKSEGELRDFFNDASNLNLPGVDDLVLGTVTRTFYDEMPACDHLGVKLCPVGMKNTDFQYLRGRVAAVISDVEAPTDENGTPVKATDGSDSVVRVSTSTNYDKYGRVLATYTYDPTVHVDSLKLLATENKYDLGGKLVSSTSYPFGLTQGGVSRAIRYEYSYDRLGRISHVVANKGFSAPSMLARYEYYPTGAVKRVTLGNDAIAIDYTYHISGAVKTAVATNLADNSTLYSETLYYEDCGTAGCTPQYNGNISRMAHEMAVDGGSPRTSDYVYDFMNRLTDVDDKEQDEFDEYFAYDAQGRITAQRRGANVNNKSGGEYVYYSGTNKLKSVANGMGGTTADKRDMSASDNFEYDAEGNMTKDYSKDMSIAYDWRGMPVEFKRQNACYDIHEKIVCDSVKLLMAYDGSGRRISKTRLRRDLGASDWAVENVTHYTGIGTEVRETHVNGQDETKVVVNMPQGLGRYTPEDAVDGLNGVSGSQLAGYRPPAKFEWYLKNHLGSTMLVYGTQPYNDKYSSYAGGVKAAYDYRAFGEQVSLAEPTDKVTENFTGKEKDDETELNYFGARYLDPMLGLWTSVDAARQYDSPYTYAGNNPIIVTDPDGNVGVVGGVASVAWGVAQGSVEARLCGKEFNYTATDAIIDFALGFVGVSIFEKGVKIAKSAKYANMIKNTKPITYKKSGAVATKHKWANRLENAEKDMVENASGIVKDVINIPGRIEHEIGNDVVDFAKDVIIDNPGSAKSVNAGEGLDALAPSDNTATRVDY